jgi:hypothetical protein
MNLEKAVNHGVHGEHGVKTIDSMIFGIHPLGETMNFCKLPFSVPSVVIEPRV